MFNISFLIFVCLLNQIISNDNKNTKENPPPNSCEEKYNKEYCKNKIIAKKISIIIGIILIFLFILLIICMILKRNSLERYDIQSNLEITLYINHLNDSSNENIGKKKKIYLFQNIIRPIKYKKEFEIYGTQCMICLDNFNENNNEICLTSCKHVFHYNCLKDYMMKTEDSHCPDCKFDFFSLLENKNIDYSEISYESSRNDNENLSILLLQSNINNNNNNNNNTNTNIINNNNQSEGNRNINENNTDNYRLRISSNKNINHSNEFLLNELISIENKKTDGDNKNIKDDDKKNNKNKNTNLCTEIMNTNIETNPNNENKNINKSN